MYDIIKHAIHNKQGRSDPIAGVCCHVVNIFTVRSCCRAQQNMAFSFFFSSDQKALMLRIRLGKGVNGKADESLQSLDKNFIIPRHNDQMRQMDLGCCFTENQEMTDWIGRPMLPALLSVFVNELSKQRA